MEPQLADMFEQARKLVAEADRKLAEEDERRREKEREAILLDLSSRVDAAFDFTSKEKMELDPRLDIQEGKALVECVVRSLRAIFVLLPESDETWSLTVLEDGRDAQPLGEFAGGTKSDPGSRRLAAARVVTAVGNWIEKIQPATKKTLQVQPRWQEQEQPIVVPTEKREPTYGTFGKFLGY